MLKARLFFWGSLGFILGVALFSFEDKIFSPGKFFILLLPFVILGATFYREEKIILISVFFFSLILGGLSTNLRLMEYYSLPNQAIKFDGSGIIVGVPEIRDQKQDFLIKIRFQEKDFYVKVTTSAWKKLFLGDKINLKGDLELPKNYSPDFDYRRYLAKDRIFYTVYDPAIAVIGQSSNPILILEKATFAFREILTDKIEKIFPSPESGLLVGILLGGNRQLPKEVQENFSQTGVSHVVAVSGYNVTIVAEYLMLLSLSIGLWRKQAFWVAIIGIIFFVLMAGLPSSAVRSGAMAVLILWAMRQGRLAKSGQAILISAWLMLVFNPLLLRYDIGFQLSFLSTLGVVYIYPVWEYFFAEKQNFLGEALGMTLSSQLAVMPILIGNFHTLSLISPLTNVLVLPAVPLAMGLGFLALIMNFFPGNIFIWLAWLGFLPLKYIIFTVKYLALCPWASLSLGVSWIWGVVWYIMGLICLTLFYRKNV